jgi:hypothetical protein
MVEGLAEADHAYPRVLPARAVVAAVGILLA